MNIGEQFTLFLKNISMPENVLETIRYRYHRLTKAINTEFWDSVSEYDHSRYVGSFGRGTAIYTSDVDILIELPWLVYERFDDYTNNGQSALLQRVRQAILTTQPVNVIADGQIVQINYTDGIKFEFLPAFKYDDGDFFYPDSNKGGKWKKTYPIGDILEITDANKKTNGDLKKLCRMLRAWKHHNHLLISGQMIDTLAYNFIKQWEYAGKGEFYFDWITRDFFSYMSGLKTDQKYWIASWSKQHVENVGYWKQSANVAKCTAIEAIALSQKEYFYSATDKWKEIYGSRFPDYK